MMMRLYAFVLAGCLLLSTTHVFANCVTLDIAAWTPAQRGYLSHMVAVAVAGMRIRESFPDAQSLKVCAETDLPALDSATLQAQAQSAVDAYVEGDAARQEELEDARTEVATNTLCNASVAVLESRLDAEKAAIQTAINAISDVATVRTYATLANNRLTAALKFIVKCGRGRDILQREQP